MQVHLGRLSSWVALGASPLLIVSAGVVALGLSSCGTDAVGVSACRQIESARCEAEQACGLVDDAAECQRYTRDHCLHGTETDKAPTPTETTVCANLIDAAGRCAKKSRTTLASDCKIAVSDGSNANVCDIVLEPERAKSCSFLIPPDDTSSESDASMDGGS